MNILLERHQLLTYGLPFLVILTSVFLALSPLLNQFTGLAMGITYDLTLTAPLVYLFFIRKKKVPLITVVPVFVLGVLLATILLPAHQQYHLNLIKTYLLPAVELSFLSIISYHVYKTVKIFKDTANENYDFYILLKESAVKALGYPKIAKIFVSEIAMVYYALFSWRKVPTVGSAFTSFKENGITALLGIILFIMLVETFIVHLLVIKWNGTVAWVLSLSSLYAVLQVIGHLKALRSRFSELKDNQLLIKYGLFGDMKVDLKKIMRIELSPNNIKDEHRKVEKLALLKQVESHNVVIYFTEQQTVEKAYGIIKECDIVLLHIDNEKEFVETINKALQQNL